MKTKSLLFLALLMFVVACGNPKPRKPIMRTGSVDMTESVAINKKIFNQENLLFKAVIEQDSLHSYIDSHYGFWYAYDSKKSMDSITPIKGDEVRFLYDIKNINGEIIYSKEELGEKNYIVDLQDFMQGIQEGIKFMKVSEKVIFLLPSQKAYAYYGDENKIGSNTPLIVTVELLEIKNN